MKMRMFEMVKYIYMKNLGSECMLLLRRHSNYLQNRLTDLRLILIDCMPTQFVLQLNDMNKFFRA